MYNSVPLFIFKFWEHGNKFHMIATKNIICCNRIKMFSCVTMVNFMQLQHFWPKNLFQKQTKILNRFLFFCLFPKQNSHVANGTSEKKIVFRILSIKFATYFFLTNQICTQLRNQNNSLYSLITLIEMKTTKNQINNSVSTNFASQTETCATRKQIFVPLNHFSFVAIERKFVYVSSKL